MEMEKNFIFSIIRFLLIITTFILGIAILSLIGLILMHPKTEVTVWAYAGVGTAAVALIILPFISILFSILGMTVLKDNDTAQMITSIFVMIFAVIALLVCFLWFGLIPLIPIDPETAGYLAAIQGTLVIVIIVQVVIIVMTILIFVIKE